MLIFFLVAIKNIFDSIKSKISYNHDFFFFTNNNRLLLIVPPKKNVFTSISVTPPHYANYFDVKDRSLNYDCC